MERNAATSRAISTPGTALDPQSAVGLFGDDTFQSTVEQTVELQGMRQRQFLMPVLQSKACTNVSDCSPQFKLSNYIDASDSFSSESPESTSSSLPESNSEAEDNEHDCSFPSGGATSQGGHIGIARLIWGIRHAFDSFWHNLKEMLSFPLQCIIAYLFLWAVTLTANHHSIFKTRAIVNASTTLLGFVFGTQLMGFAKTYREAIVWATVIHASKRGNDDVDGLGVLVLDLAKDTSETVNLITAFRLCKRRWCNRGAKRAVRSSYDRRLWSLDILFLFILVLIASTFPFISGRLISVDVVLVQQSDEFNEVFVWGDLSATDIAGATNVEAVFTSFAQTWTLEPFASLTDLPPSVSFDFGNDTIHFAESYAAQLRENGVGIGTFNLNSSTSARDVSVMNTTDTVDQWTGLVHFPKWGIRIYCEKLPEPEKYLTPVSSDAFTYVFVPDFFLKELFANLSLAYPDLPPADLMNLLSENDSLPAGVNPNTIIVAGKFYDNGVAHSFLSSPVDLGESGEGWVEIEVLSVRLNQTYAPNGTFPVYGRPEPDATGAETRIGYDAAVCVEAYEPWIVETYNSSGVLPYSTQIVRRGSTIPTKSKAKSVAKRLQKRDADGVDVQHTLSSTGKVAAFVVAHDNSINQMVKDNGRDNSYVPSPLLVSFTDGFGPNGYTELSAVHYSSARAKADATNVLPFLAGTGAFAAHFYPSHVRATTHLLNVPLWITLSVLCVILVIAKYCVPRLPGGVPHRGIGLMSWITVLFVEDMISQLPDVRGVKLDVQEVEKKLTTTRVKYNV